MRNSLKATALLAASTLLGRGAATEVEGPPWKLSDPYPDPLKPDRRSSDAFSRHGKSYWRNRAPKRHLGAAHRARLEKRLEKAGSLHEMEAIEAKLDQA